MDAFDDAVQKLQRDLDNLRELGPQPIRDGNGPGNGDEGDETPGPPPPNPNLRFAGMEVTQGIQFFNFNGRGTGVGADNSIPLVRNKPTVIRVYIDRTTLPFTMPSGGTYPIPSTLTGWCRAFHYVNGQPYPLHSTTARLPPINPGPIVAQAANQINRGNATHTLNFRLDGWLCTGTISFSVKVWDSTFSEDAADLQGLASNIFSVFNFEFRGSSLPFIDPRPRIHGVRIIYTGPDPSGAPTDPPLGPPNETQMAATLSNSFVTKVFPISGINYTGSTIAEFSGDLRVDGSPGCGAGWNALIAMLQDLRSASSSGDVFVGVLPSNVPLAGSPAGGCGGGGVAAGRVFDDATMAEEIGHAYGRKHAPTTPTVVDPIPPPPAPPPLPVCTIPPNVDPGYPTFTLSDGTVLPPASIGEFGFDTTTADVRNPAVTLDFMGHCPGRVEWVSPYTWRELYYGFYFGLPPATAALASTEEPPLAREYLILNFRMYRDGEVELLPSLHLAGATPPPPSDEEAPVVVELRAADGRGVGFHRCHLNNPNVDPDSPYRDFHEVLPWEPETTSIAFLRDADGVQTLEVEERAPQITSRPVAEREGDRVRLAWEGQHDENSITYLVRYSNDGGNTWLAVAAGLTEPEFVADLACLPGGEQCLFQVAASSTIRTTVAQTRRTMAVPVKPRRPYILSPEPNSMFVQGESVVLGGMGFSPDFQTAPLDEVVWTSNIDGFLGYGYEVITHTLTPGLHKITLGVADGLGEEAATSLLIKIQRKE